MDINNINSINHINTVQQGNYIEKIASGLELNKASDNAASLAIADNLRLDNGTLAQSIDNASSGIAMSNIAQDAIANQKELLTNIKTETLKAMNGTMSEQDREIIANNINKMIEQYDNIANSTNYNGNNLLKTTGDEANDDISIVGDEGVTVNMKKADTISVSDKLKLFMGDFSTNPDSMGALLGELDSGISNLSSMQNEYGSASNSLESMARNYMTQRTNVAEAESVLRDLDFSKGIANFSKSNIQSIAGYLAQSQAHAVQSRTVALLS